MDGEAYLIQPIYKKDSIGQAIPDGETRLGIFVSEESVSRREWMDAGRNGLNPEHLLKTAAINYSGESEVEYEGVRYAIYRTFSPPDSDEIELYLHRKAGVQGGISKS